MRSTGTISFDFDGVLSEDRQGDGEVGRTDFDGIIEAHRRGYSVAVSTCSHTGRVAEALRGYGFRVYEDPEMLHLYWMGHGELILVTNRKVCADMHVDDRGWRHQFGEPWGPVLDQMEREQSS